MSSKIEQQIDQIEDFIDSCRYQKFSKTNIIVDKDELDGLLETRMNWTDSSKSCVPGHRRRSSIIRESSTIKRRFSRTQDARQTS